MIMKKTIILLSAALAFIACNKETPVKESASGISKIVFNVDINRADDTKGVKAGWENGDKVYVFFQGLVGDNKYAVFTYNGTSWDKNANDITAKDIFDAKVDYGDRLTAICVPYGDQPTFSPSGDSFTMTNKVQTFYLSASTTYSTGIVEESTIEIGASLKMKAPDNLIQICVQGTGGKPASGNEFVLTVNNVKPFTVEEIVPGSPVSCTTGTVNFPLPALLTYVNKDPGYYFWGILDNASAGAIDYNFQLVQQNVEKKYAVSSRSKKVSGKELTGSAAIKLTGLTNNGNFVSLGYADGPLWATGNIDKTTSKIVDPLEAGEYFRYGKTTPYSSSEENYTGEEDPLSTSADVAYSVNTAWRIPTRAQFDALASNTTTAWKTGWTDIGTTKGGRLITSKVNGISLFFAAAGFYESGTLYVEGGSGLYWSSTPCDSSDAYLLVIDSDNIVTNVDDRYEGFSVRPVQN